MCTLMMCVSVYVGVCFSMACGRMGPTSTGTSLTMYKKSQAWVSLNNLLILWISTQSCDNDTSWVDLTGQTAGGRGGKPICSCKDWGETLITNTPKETKGQRDMYSSVSTSLPPSPLPSPSLGVSFPSVSIWMYEFVTGTMDWLCCLLKGCVGTAERRAPHR